MAKNKTTSKNKKKKTQMIITMPKHSQQPRSSPPKRRTDFSVFNPSSFSNPASAIPERVAFSVPQGSNALAVKPVRKHMMRKSKGMRIACQATSIPADRVPDMGKRQLMNFLLLGAISLPTAGMLVPYTYFFVPPGSGSSAGGTVAKDAIRNDVIVENWLKAHGPSDNTYTRIEGK